ncbi:MAG: pitrilysin family protein [Bacteroidales bacterium]|nr:pitrilysin family protein [Bacteroidales bacterium]
MKIQNPDRKIPPQLISSDSLKLNEPKVVKLSNNMPLYLFQSEIHSASRLDIVLDAGSIWQHKKLTASTTIKMLREGTTRFSGGEISSKIDYYGAFLDLQTTKDTAWISLYSMNKHLHQLLPMIKSMLTEAGFRKRDFNLLNSRQKQSFLVSNQKPKQLARNKFNQLLFGADTPYGQVADSDDFDKLGRDDLIRFYQEKIYPEQAYAILAGPIDEELIQLIDEFVGFEWRAKGVKNMFKMNATFKPGYHHILRKNSLQSAVVSGKTLMLRSHPDYIPFLLLNTVLGGYFGSRLMANIREDKGYTYGINSQVVPMRHATAFMISTETGSAVTQDAIREIKNELNRLREIPVPETELKLVKNYLNGSYLRALDGVFNQAERFRSVKDQGLGMNFYEKSIKRIQETTSEELLNLAQKYLDPESMITVVVGDEKQKH